MSIKMKPTAHPKEFMCTYIDKDVQKMYQPLNLMQQLTLNPKYQIKGGFIKPNNVKFILLSFCGLISYVGVSMYRIWELVTDENMQRYTPIKFLNFATLIDASFNSTGYIMNFILPIIEVKQNITFILTFQEIHRFIHKTDNCKVIIDNWISVVTYFSFNIFACIYIYVYYMPNWYVMYYVFILCTRDTNPIYAIGVIKLLTEKVFLWNSELLMFSKTGHREMRCDRMFRAYGQILSCYDVYKNIYQVPILYQTVDVIITTLVKIEVLIDFFQYIKNTELVMPIAQAMLYLIVMKSLILQIALCQHIEAFYDAMKSLQDSCTLVLASNCTDEVKKLCKNIQRTHRAVFSKMTVCGLFYVDIHHLVNLLLMINSYVIILLQFAFLKSD